jgi:DNA-binding SARP family transcriptional activator
VEFRILGPLEVRSDDRSLQLGGAKPRAVLAILLTRANEVVSRDRLIDELWGENPPATAVNVLQGYVSDLRKALGSGGLVTRAPGYMVAVEPGELDLHRFERLVEEARGTLAAGDAGRAADTLREALALWRGPPLADFAYEPFAQAEITRLEELRLVALERRIEADLVLGRHAELVGELEALIPKHPLRERLRAQLMLALYRSGRQAEALEAYQEARRALVDELGIDPSQSLQELEKAILRQDHALEPAPAAPASAGGAVEPEPLPPERSILVVPQDDSNLDALVELAEPLARKPPREVILARLVADDHELSDAMALLTERRKSLLERRVAARVAAFTSTEPGGDTVLLASEQDVDLLLADISPDLLENGLLREPLASLLEAAPCDVALLVCRAGRSPELGADRPVFVPFGGAEHDWTAVEIGAWVAKSQGTTIRLLGTVADPEQGRRDASRLLARASLIVQRAVGVVAEPALVSPGPEGVVRATAGASVVVIGLSSRWRQEGLGPARLEVARSASAPVLLVRHGLRPGGLAPRGSLTRFTWSLAGQADKAAASGLEKPARRRSPAR